MEIGLKRHVLLKSCIFIEVSVLFCFVFSGKISEHSVGISLAKDTLPPTSLSFPGKICTDKGGERVVVADTGHHRILLVSKEGVILNVIGGGEKYEAGFVDGSFQEARFHSPQGVTFENKVIYVADTENHAVRQVRIFKCPVLCKFVCLLFICKL